MTPEDARHHARAHALAAERTTSTGYAEAYTVIAESYEALAKELEAEAAKAWEYKP